MKISLKLTVIFSVALAFLIGVGITAILVVGRLDTLLADTSYYNQQTEQVGTALRALRTAPDQTAAHLARIGDMQRWARTDTERELLRVCENLLQNHRSAQAAAPLEELAAYYWRSTAAAQQQLLRIHHRAILGTIVIIINGSLLVILLGWLVRHWLLSPVSDLADSMSLIAAEKFDHKIKSTAGQEFDRITASLNIIAGKLRDYEQRVANAEKFAIVGQACTHVTHNVRSLLNSIRSLAQHESNAAGARHDSRVGFNYIIASVNKLDGWVRDLHAAVAPSNPNRAPLQVEPVIHDALLLLQPRLHERDLKVDYQAPDELPAVVADRSQFEQAFVAVMTNAIEASPDGGRIGVFLKNGAPGRVSIHIQDEGAGMTEVTRAHAFDPFFTTKPESTGLGLTVAQTIIQRHGGEIQIENAAQQGTRVLIHLPVATPAIPASR